MSGSLPQNARLAHAFSSSTQQADLGTRGQPGPHKKFQARQDGTVIPYVKEANLQALIFTISFAL